jgi:hypothetical protein
LVHMKPALKAIYEDLSAYFRTVGREREPIFHIVSGTSIGAINAALLVSYVKENKTWEGSGERLVEFWEMCLLGRLLKTYHTLQIIGILGVD